MTQSTTAISDVLTVGIASKSNDLTSGPTSTSSSRTVAQMVGYIATDRFSTYQTKSSNETLPRKTGKTTEVKTKSVSEGNVGKADVIRILKGHCSRALLAAQELVKACDQDDFMTQFTLGTTLTKHLDLMWKCRGGRDRNWGKLLNFLQSALTCIEFDTLSHEPSKAIRSVVEMLCSSAIENDDILVAKRHLSNVNLDPWAAISQKHVD